MKLYKKRSTCCWLNHVQTRRCSAFFCVQQIVLLKEYICSHSAGGPFTISSISVRGYFCILPHCCITTAIIAVSITNEEKKPTCNCIDQQEPLFLLFIFDFSLVSGIFTLKMISLQHKQKKILRPGRTAFSLYSEFIIRKFLPWQGLHL